MEIDYKKRQRRARLKEICGKYVYPWLRELGEAAKRNGAYPISLCDYYPEPQDKEVAGVVGLLVPERRRESYIFVLRDILGDTPSSMVESRGFMHLNVNRKLINNTGLGVSRSDIFNVLDWIWAVKHKRGLSLEQVVISELGIIKKSHAEPLSLVIPETNYRNRLKTLLAKMTMRDGYGAGLWSYIDEKDLSIPDTRDIRDVLLRYYPIKRDGIDDAVSFMGFENPIDFLYCYWGYLHAVSVIPDEIDALEKKIGKWFNALRVKTALRCDLPTDELFI